MRKIKDRDALKDRYVSQKTRDLQDFGYETLTRDEVSRQYDKVMNGESDLNVIGMFIKADVDATKEKQ